MKPDTAGTSPITGVIGRAVVSDLGVFHEPAQGRVHTFGSFFLHSGHDMLYKSSVMPTLE